MSDNKRVPGRVPQCKVHPTADIVRKRMAIGDLAICQGEGQPHSIYWYCMSEMNGKYCQYIRHTTATHQTLSGETWVDVDMEKAEVEVALGDEEIEYDIV